jgi:membrane-associated protease RseP (regulator of RpoE activity)
MELKAIDGIETPDWDAVRLQLVAKIGDPQTTISVSPFGSDRVRTKCSIYVTGVSSQTKKIPSLRWAFVRAARRLSRY